MSDSIEETPAASEKLAGRESRIEKPSTIEAMPKTQHRFQLPGFFTLPDGSVYYIENEVDRLEEYQADVDQLHENERLFEETGVFPGSYKNPGDIPEYERYVKWDTAFKKVEKELILRKSQLPLGSADRTIIDAELDAFRAAMRAKEPKVRFRPRPRAPHTVFREKWSVGDLLAINLSDRTIMRTMEKVDRIKTEDITGLAPLSDEGKAKIMLEPSVYIPLDVCGYTNTLRRSVKFLIDNPEGPEEARNRVKEIFSSFIAGYERFVDAISVPAYYESIKDKSLYDFEKSFRTHWDNVFGRYESDHPRINNMVEWGFTSRDETAETHWPTIIKTVQEGLDLYRTYLPLFVDEFYTWVQKHGLPCRAHGTEIEGSWAAAFVQSSQFLSRANAMHHNSFEVQRRNQRNAERAGLQEPILKVAIRRNMYGNWKNSVHIEEIADKIDGPEVVNRVADERLAFQTATIDQMPEVPHLSKDIKLFPHQAKTGAQLDQKNRAFVSAVMGAGKTSMFYSDAMIAIKNGKAKRPAVVMPTNTVEQQVDELKHKFGDYVNIIGLTNQSFRKMGKGDERFETLKKLIIEAPPNTIVLVAYEWLSLEPESYDTGKTRKNKTPMMAKRYTRGTFLTDECGVDMVILDECHRIKNIDTARAKATMALSSAPVKRVGSGTLFPNTPDDVVGPASFLDPTLFGSHEEFCKRYSLETVRSKVVSFTPEMLKEVRNDLLEYGMVNIRRTAWMHMMPDRTETIHTTRLSPQLQKLYEALYNATISKIEGDPVLSKYWKEFAEDVGAEDLDIDENGFLLTILGRIDQFVSAPDSKMGGNIQDLIDEAQNAETAEEKKAAKEKLDGMGATLLRIRGAIENMPEMDRASPKVRKAAEIIDKHFADPSNVLKTEDGREFEGKVIVFVSNVDTAKHFQKYLPMLASSVTEAEIGFFKADSKGRRALAEFKDPFSNMKVLCAVDAGLREGHNLQVANRVIRGSLLWTPGAMEQTYARVYRPGTLANEVFIDIIVTENTLEVAKFGRLLSKYDAIQRVNSEFEDDSTEELPPISMNIKNIETYTSMSMLDEYMDRYNKAAEFDLAESKRLQAEYGSEFIDRAGGRLPGADLITGLLPYYDEEDAYRPVKVRVMDRQLVISDPDSFEWLNKRVCKKLGLKEATSSGQVVYTGNRPLDMDAWVETAETFGLDVALIEESGSTAVKIKKDEVTKSSKPKKTKVKMKSRKKTGPLKLLCVGPVGSGILAMYAKKQQKGDGSETYQYVIVHHTDGEVGSAARGDRIHTFHARGRGSGLAKLTGIQWDHVHKTLYDGFGEVTWYAPGDVPEVPDVAPVVETTVAPLPANVVRSLRFLQYDGVKYLTIDSDDDRAPDLRPLGFVWYNAFFQRPFQTMKDARVIIDHLQRVGLDIDEDDFSDHARDAIWKRKVPQRKLLREQLQEMRKRRRSLKKGKVSIHYVQYKGMHHLAVNALEHQDDIRKVRAVGRFGQVTSGFWMPVPGKAEVQKVVRQLESAGVKVVYWEEFKTLCYEWFGYKPTVDLSVPEDVKEKLELPREDPSPAPSSPEVIKDTLKKIRKKPAKGLSDKKLDILRHTSGSDIIGYGGDTPFNIAVIQSLLNKGYMVGTQERELKRYVDVQLTEKGREAIGVDDETPPAPTPEPTSTPKDVKDVSTTPLDWKMVADELDDPFEPRALWRSVASGRQVSLVLLEDDETWEVKLMRRHPETGKRQSKIFQFTEKDLALSKVQSLIGARS